MRLIGSFLIGEVAFPGVLWYFSLKVASAQLENVFQLLSLRGNQGLWLARLAASQANQPAPGWSDGHCPLSLLYTHTHTHTHTHTPTHRFSTCAETFWVCIRPDSSTSSWSPQFACVRVLVSLWGPVLDFHTEDCSSPVRSDVVVSGLGLGAMMAKGHSHLIKTFSQFTLKPPRWQLQLLEVNHLAAASLWAERVQWSDHLSLQSWCRESDRSAWSDKKRVTISAENNKLASQSLCLSLGGL